jgi:hypothetical protein
MVRAYQLYLSTDTNNPIPNLVVPLDQSNRGNVTWQINFRALFGNDFRRFKRCSVRAELISKVWSPADNNDTVAYSGVLTMSLPSTYSASTVRGIPLMLVSPMYATAADANRAYYHVSTMDNAHGVDINMPSDNQYFNLQFVNIDTFQTMTNTPDYQILLQFELSEPIPEA